jgi:hypothetical protein
VSRPTATLLAAFLALALTACGGGSSGPTGVLQETSDNLGDIRSGDLTLRMHVEGGGKQAGFELQGRFALADEGELPVADLDYTQIAGDKEEKVRLISTGEKAFVAIGNDVYKLPEKQTASLRSAGGQVSGDSGLGSLDIGGWLIQPKLSDGGEVAGVETDRIQADLDVVRAANDILALIAGLDGRQATQLEGRNAEQLRAATKSATIDVHTGKDDRLLRRLVIEARLGADVPAKLRDQLGGLANARFTFELAIADPNEDVEVQEPEGAKPLPSSSS